MYTPNRFNIINQKTHVNISFYNNVKNITLKSVKLDLPKSQNFAVTSNNNKEMSNPTHA